MLVRIKRRGDLPHPPNSFAIEMFRGCCLEVEPAETYHDDTCISVEGHAYGCGQPLFVITDGRYLSIRPHEKGMRRCICACYLIDDIEAFNSDFCDEEAKEGDLAFVQVPVTVPR